LAKLQARAWPHFLAQPVDHAAIACVRASHVNFVIQTVSRMCESDKAIRTLTDVLSSRTGRLVRSYWRSIFFFIRYSFDRPGAVLLSCFPIQKTRTHNRLTALCSALPGWAGTRRNIRLLTPILFIRHPLSTSFIYYDPQHSSCSIYVLDSPIPQPLFSFCLVFRLIWDPVLYTPYISSLSHHLHAVD